MLYAREYGWDDELRAARGADRRRVRPRHGPRVDRRGRRRRAPARCCACTTTTTTAKLRTLLVEPSARGLGLGTRLVDEVIKHAAPARLHDADAVDQRRPARRPPHLRAGRLHAPERGAAPRVRPRPRRADLVPYPPSMDRDALRALQAPLKEQYKTAPGAGPDHAQGHRDARRGRLLLGRHRPRDRQRRPAPRHRRRRQPAVLGRHAARGARRLRRRDARRGQHEPRRSRSTRARSTPRATSTSAARWASTRPRRSASATSACASSSTPTPTTSSSPRCSS